VLSIQRIQVWFRIGELIAVNLGMLRIKLPPTSDSGVVVLEGRLTGMWSRALLLLARGEKHGQGSTFDLMEVIYVDSAGENALQTLGRNYGASFIAESAYGKYLCKRLKLRRVSIAEVENIDGKVHECSPIPIIREAASSKRNNSLT
jgi:hypothetical protein